MNKAELRKKINVLPREVSENYPHNHMLDQEEVLNLIDQLDEPETLSQVWIDEHAIGDWNEYVYADDLQNLLVPKQEEQSSKTVADVIADFFKSLERLKEVLDTEVEEKEE